MTSSAAVCVQADTPAPPAAAPPTSSPTNNPRAPAASGKPRTAASQTPDQVQAAPTLAAQGAGVALHPVRVAVKAHVTSAPQLAPVPAAAHIASQQQKPPTVPAQRVKPVKPAAVGSTAEVNVTGGTKKVKGVPTKKGSKLRRTLNVFACMRCSAVKQ